MRKLVGGVVLALSVAAQAALADEAPRTPDAEASAGRQGADYRLLQLDGHQVKWGATAVGTGATVRYALVPAAMDFGETRNCRGLRPMDDLLAASGIDPARVPAEVAAAFDMWETAANITLSAG